jgi:ethanolamine utilization protein EutA
MRNRVTLVGLDFGTTTSSAIVAKATLVRNAVTGRTELSAVEERYRSPMVFTPLDGDRLDLPGLESYVDSWLAQAEVRPADVFGGGALLTGLTAQKENAAGLVALVRRRLGDALIATADDPCLESWLAFLGSCGTLSRGQPDRPVLNLDIGGGTTNLALGQDGHVMRTGCLFVGARHVQVAPGTYRITGISRYGAMALTRLAIRKGIGDELNQGEVVSLVDFQVGVLEAAVRGDGSLQTDPAVRQLVQRPYHPSPQTESPIITLSGGVGELVYAHLNRAAWPTTTAFGDLGINLAQAILHSELLGRDLPTHQPTGGGRATVYGLLRHTTEISGNTLFLPHPELLPLPNLPVLGRLSPDSTDADVRELLARVRHSPSGGSVFVVVSADSRRSVRALGDRLARTIRESAFPVQHPLVLLVERNVGKALGHYVTEWGRLPVTLIVLDQVSLRDAHYVQIGRLREQVVPVSFFGLFDSGGS